MSDRRRYLVTYDIADDRRRTRVFETLLGTGDHTQYSVFVCELDRRELAELRAELHGHIHAHDDQVLVVDKDQIPYAKFVLGQKSQ